MLSSGKDTQQSVGSEFNQTVGENHSLSVGKSMNVRADEHAKLRTVTGNINIQSGEELLENANGNVRITARKKTDILSGSDITIQSGTDVYIAK